MAEDKKTEAIQGVVEAPQRAWRPQDADREVYRYETKKRIQHYTVPPQTIFRPAKPTPTIRDESFKRVAVYARVSTKNKEQVSSIENQTKYYTDKIARTPNWELTEVYSDEGKSGTSKKWRPQFLRMLEDAANKRMDLIVCASISRFARNISTLVEEVRKLKTTNPSNPVGVYFETEDIYTLDPKGDLVYVLGDMIWKARNNDAPALIESLNGQIILIKGNHDRFLHNSKAKAALAGIKDYDDICVTLEDGTKRRVILCHYFMPMYIGHRYNAIHLHAHSHFSHEADLEVAYARRLRQLGFRNEIYNVGCMYWNFEPVTLDEILAHGETVSPYFGSRPIDLGGNHEQVL